MRRALVSALWVLTFVGVLAATYSALNRYRIEQHNRRIELALDYTEVANLSQLSGVPLETLLQKLKQSHVTSIAITEDTLNSLELQGQVHSLQWVDPVTISVSSPETLARIKKGLMDRGIKVAEEPTGRKQTVFEAATDTSGEEAPDDKQPDGFAVSMEWSNLRNIGIGIDTEAAQTVRRSGLEVVGRISNFPGANPNSMSKVLASLKENGVKTVIFQGLEVFGYRGLYPETAEVFLKSGLNFGQVEFGKQKGDEQLGVKLKGQFVRVHSISDAEMGSLDETEAVERFVRAARERNIRLCYVRLLTTVGVDPVAINLGYLDRIAKGISRNGEMDFGSAVIYENTPVTRVIFLFTGVGIAAGIGLLLLKTVPTTDKTVIATTFCFSVLFVLLSVFAGEMGRRLTALAASLTFPTLACIKRDLLYKSESPAIENSFRSSVHSAVREIIFSSMVTAIGIVNVVGLLATRPFIVKANQFLGIKASHALPVFFIGLVGLVGLPSLQGSWKTEFDKMVARTKEFMSEPLRVGQLILGIIGLIAIVFILARTGNDPGVGVSGFELKFRSLLDRFLPVRPRTKEFLIGHPAFVLALALWYRGRRKWAIPLYVIGVIGQVSLLNTFCHTHTPLRLSLIRDVTGLVIGTLIGLMAFWIIEIVANRAKKIALQKAI